MNIFFSRKPRPCTVSINEALFCDDYTKLLKVIDSCDRQIHFDVANRLVGNLVSKWGLTELDNSLMCTVDYKLDKQWRKLNATGGM